jgi:choline dehydrogenase-like flavoprotein
LPIVTRADERNRGRVIAEQRQRKRRHVGDRVLEAGGFWYADADVRSPDIQFDLGLGSGIEAGVAQMKNPGVTLNSAFLRPRSRGTVRLASVDPKAAPLIDPNYWADPYDRQCAIKGLRLARDIMRQPALKPFVLAERLPGDGLESYEELAQYACRSAKTNHHPVGACPLGQSPFGDDAGAQAAWPRRAADRRRFRDAVRAVVQHQRTDDHERKRPPT